VTTSPRATDADRARLLQRALEHHQAGRSDAARQDYDALLASVPSHADAWHLSGVLAWQTGNAGEGQRRVERALQLAPRQGLFWNSLGAILKDVANGAEQGAAVPLREEARRAFERSVECDPKSAAAWSNLAAARSETGRLEDAIAAASRAIELQPDLADARVNLGNALRVLGRMAEAERELVEAVRFAPESPLARNNLGSLLSDEGRTDEALPHFEAALKADANYAPAWINLGQASQTRGDWEAASRFYERAAELRASDGLRLRGAMCLPVVPKSVLEIASARERYATRLAELEGQPLLIADPPREVGTTPFALAYHGQNDCELQRRLAVIERRATPDLGWIAPHCREPRGVSRDRRLRVGFVSQHWHDHSNARLMVGLLRAWPRNGTEEHAGWEVVLCRFAGREDAWTRYAGTCADREVVLDTSWRTARERLAAEQFDVLIYTDIGMEPVTRALAHARLAPVQMTTWGVPVTTGLETIDAYVTSSRVEGAGVCSVEAGVTRSPHYFEPVLALSVLPSVYVPPYQIRLEGVRRLVIEDSPRDPADVRRLVEVRRREARTRLGVSSTDRLYVCPQSLFKLHPDFDGAIDEILRHDPNGLVLFVAGAESRWTELFKARLGERVGPRGSRVHVLPRMPADSFQDLLAAADVLLDPWRFGGGNTTYEGLAWGTPIVTAPGEFMRGRVTLGCYSQMGCLGMTSEWPCVARDEAEYAERAVQLAGGGDGLRGVILDKARSLYHREEAAREWAEGAVRMLGGT
jgi:protein O-GlcNAc transferase